MRRLVPILALCMVVAAVGAARSLLAWSTRQPTEIVMQSQLSSAEQQPVAVAGIAAAEASAPLQPAAEPPGPQLAVLEPAAPPSPEAASSAPQAPSMDQATSNPSARAFAPAAPAAINDTAMSQSTSPPEPLAAPEMVSLPGGTLTMGSNFDPSEAPIHGVSIKPFAISKAVVTVRAWSQCVAAKACSYVATEENEDAPVSNVSFNDAQQFVAWLAKETRMNFRLPTEAEWEYAARGGTRTKYWWGDSLQPGMVNCKGCNGDQNARQISKVEAYKPNPFGLYDMGGNVAQWVADCWHKNYQGAVADGSAWVDSGSCIFHVIRSGSWRNAPNDVRSASRDYYDGRIRYPMHGFRVARSL
jgi:formylglycine-generating enzyme required for sulfatase activity